jgi:uridine phosphorylase
MAPPAVQPNLDAYGPPPAPGIHLHPTSALAPRVLLPGDPGRALVLAQTLLTRPLMFNHHRGLWGYTGVAADGALLTIQSTGMGGPSAAIVFEELIDLGAARAIRIGTCGALDPALALGQLLVARTALAADGTSRALGAAGSVDADAELSGALERAAEAHGSGGALVTLVASTDLFYDPDPERARGWRAAGASAVEMEAATLLQIGVRRGIPVGCALVVSDVDLDLDLDGPDASPRGGRTHIEPAELLAAVERMGAVAAAALS